MHSPEEVAAAYAAGLRVFGENRVEEAAPKAAAVARLVAPAKPPAWHMIGHLQSRKAEDVLPWVSMMHSVDSVKLAQRLGRFATSPPSPLPSQGGGGGVGDLPILLEVNVSGETSKYGFRPGGVARRGGDHRRAAGTRAARADDDGAHRRRS